jgi:hypothetical protein
MFSLGSVLCLFYLPGADGETRPKEPPDPRFSIHAKVVEALEGGPLVLLVTLDYKGNKEIVIRSANWWNNSHVEPQAKWRYRIVGALHIGQPYGRRKLSPGDQLCEVHYLHHQYCDIAQGKVSFEVTWRIVEPGEEGKEIACPTERLEADVLPLTEARLRALCQCLETKLEQAPATGEERRKRVREVVNYLRDMNRAGLTPVLWRLIESFADVAPISDYLPLLYDAAQDKRSVNRRLVKLASNPEYPEFGSIFSYWRRQPVPGKPDPEDEKLAKRFCNFDPPGAAPETVTLSAEEIAPLLQSDNLWIRVWTHVTFPVHTNKEWTERLFRDLRESQQPLPEKVFARLLSDLDNDDFAVRQRATEELQRHGERARAQITQALQGQPSPEVRDRLKHVLEEIAKGPPRVIQVTLPQLENANTIQSRAILRVLAEGETDSWATREAKAALQRLSKP